MHLEELQRGTVFTWRDFCFNGTQPCILMTISEKPTSRLQRCRLTIEGQSLVLQRGRQ